MIASFSAMGVDLRSIALIVLHSFVGSVLRSNVSTNCLHFCLYSGDLIVHLLQGGRGRVSGSEVISCYHLFQYLCWNRLCIESVSSKAALRMTTREIITPFWQLVGSRLLLNLSSISLLYRSQFAFSG